jgi:hypothetical protein
MDKVAEFDFDRVREEEKWKMHFYISDEGISLACSYSSPCMKTISMVAYDSLHLCRGLSYK